MGDHVLFFYGTLMAPPILHRVIHGHSTPEPWQKALLTIKPAILHGYRRHRVRYADYPGIIPTTPSSSSGADDTAAAAAGEASVLGTVVWGLTDGDVYRLDRFEGSEYEKKAVRVRVLNHQQQQGEGEHGTGEIQAVLGAAAETEGSGETKEGEEVEAVTYVWTAGKERLENAEWDFEAFKRDKMAWWVQADERDW